MVRTRAFALAAGLSAAFLGQGACARGEPVGESDPAEGFGGAPDAAACVGLTCKRVACADGRSTRITGRVMDPAGRHPVYNAIVYVPDGPLPNVVHGATCDRCGSVGVSVAASALTKPNGDFEIEDAPVDAALPLVVQIGKFRRTLEVTVQACADNVVPPDATRLPRNVAEGTLPLIALTTGGADSLECLVRNMGIDDAEIVPGGGATGSVQLFRGRGGGGRDGATVPEATSLWNDAAQLGRYDLVALSCEGEEANDLKGGDTPLARGAMHAYAQAGGHVVASHFQYTWLKDSPYVDFRGVATWGAAAIVGTEYDVDTSFPKGQAFASWLSVVGASPAPGKIRLDDVTYSVAEVNEPTQSWIRRGAQSVRYLTFNTPRSVPVAEQCGRVVFADLHVSGSGGSDVPSGCPPRDAPLTPQQLALEFLVFDALGCVVDDATTPDRPR